MVSKPCLCPPSDRGAGLSSPPADPGMALVRVLDAEADDALLPPTKRVGAA
jgi:hypothetical protein